MSSFLTIPTTAFSLFGWFDYILQALGWIMNGIYQALNWIYELLGINSNACIIGFSIIIFTIVVRMIMIPTTIKQQKTTKLNSVITPEVQEIQKKYKNRKDQQSQMQMQGEIRSVYDKYGTSPTGGCLPLLIQLPIMFALYRVIWKLLYFISPLKNHLINLLQNSKDHKAADYAGEKLYDYLDKLTMTSPDSSVTPLQSLIENASGATQADATAIRDAYSFFGIDLLKSPSQMFSDATANGFDFWMVMLALLIPVLAGLFQFLSVKVSNKVNQNAAMNAENPMAGSMKTMNYIMPLMSVVFCFTFNTSIGIYWVIGSVVMMAQTVLINRKLRKISIEDIIDANKEKAAKKAEKRKAKEGIYRERVLEASKTSTKNLSSSESKDKEERINQARENMKKSSGSLAAKANMVSEFNKRNGK